MKEKIIPSPNKTEEGEREQKRKEHFLGGEKKGETPKFFFLGDGRENVKKVGGRNRESGSRQILGTVVVVALAGPSTKVRREGKYKTCDKEEKK